MRFCQGEKNTTNNLYDTGPTTIINQELENDAKFTCICKYLIHGSAFTPS